MLLVKYFKSMFHIYVYYKRWGQQFLVLFFRGRGGCQVLIKIRVINPLGNYVYDANCVRNLKAIVYKIGKFYHSLIPCVKIRVYEVRCVVKLLFKS